MRLLQASIVPADLAHPGDRVKLARAHAEAIHSEPMENDSVWLRTSRPAIAVPRFVGDGSGRPSPAGGGS